MHRTIEAIIHADGTIEALEDIEGTAPRRALLTILDEPPASSLSGVQDDDEQAIALLRAAGLLMVPEDIPADLEPLTEAQLDELWSRIPLGTPLSQMIIEDREEFFLMPFTLLLRSPCVSDCLPLGNRWYLLRYFNALQRVSHRVSGLLARRKKHYVLHLATKPRPKKMRDRATRENVAPHSRTGIRNAEIRNQNTASRSLKQCALGTKEPESPGCCPRRSGCPCCGRRSLTPPCHENTLLPPAKPPYFV